MTKRARRRPPGVIFASPVAQPPRSRHAPTISGPPARWIAPSTPPPPRSVVFAALTIASVSCRVMSPRTSSSVAPAIVRCPTPLPGRERLGGPRGLGGPGRRGPLSRRRGDRLLLALAARDRPLRPAEARLGRERLLVVGVVVAAVGAAVVGGDVRLVLEHGLAGRPGRRPPRQGRRGGAQRPQREERRERERAIPPHSDRGYHPVAAQAITVRGCARRGRALHPPRRAGREGDGMQKAVADEPRAVVF